MWLAGACADTYPMRRSAAVPLAALMLATVVGTASARPSARSWAAPQIAAVVEAGLMAPSAAEFRPADPLTAAEFAMVLTSLGGSATVDDPDRLVTMRQLDAQLVTLVGVPGIGKSRLVQELFQIVEQTPELINWRQGRSLPYGEGVALWALGEMVKAQAGVLESDRADEASAKLTAAVRDLVSDDVEARWVERHLRPLAGIRESLSTGEVSLEEAFAAWRRFLESMAESRPTVLIFEDLHWADDALLEFVDSLADRVVDVPLLVVCSARPELLERRPGWGGGKRNATTLSIAPLSDEETARLLGELLDRAVLPAEQQLELLQRAGGIPLFAEEYVRMQHAGGTADVPETLHGIVAARIDGLRLLEKRGGKSGHYSAE